MTNNFDVPRRSSSEFRARQSSLCRRKSGSDVVVEGFMKFDKKLAGNVETAFAVDKGKKPVSYMDLYRRKFVNRNKTRAETSCRRSCEDLSSCETPAMLLPRDEQHTVELDLYYSSRGSRETSSAAEQEYERAFADIRNNRDDLDEISKCDFESVQPVNPRRRVFYKSHPSIEDRKRYPANKPQQPDRSLVSSQRIAIEYKEESLMRGRSYGDSVSARNRQRILRRAQQLELGCRRRNLSLMSVIVLALSNMLLTFLLLQSETCPPDSLLKQSVVTDWSLDSLEQENRHGEEESQQQLQLQCPTQQIDYQPSQDDNTMRLDVKLGRWDSRRLFRTFDSVLVGSEYSEVSHASKVCLATQTSLEKLHSIVQVAHHWTGPISVALYAAGDEEFDALQRYVLYLRHCYAPIRERVIFSLAIPKNRPPKKQPRGFELPDNVDCAKPEATLNKYVSGISTEQTSWRARNVYPQNHMRNLARKNCQTEWVFLTDVDVVPCLNLATRLEQFLASVGNSCDKCAYVVPTYELDIRVRFPSNKSELVRLAKKGLARPFHQKVFIHNQFATNFTRWILDVNNGAKGNENVKSGRVYVSHDVTNFEFFYEPFYVSRDVAPAHDERFLGYGYTRNTQVYEMFVAGYQFKVLSPVFTGHWGLQTRKGRPAWRERQNSVNRKHFESFRREIFARYQRDTAKLIKGPNT